jgi:protein phosphatase
MMDRAELNHCVSSVIQNRVGPRQRIRALISPDTAFSLCNAVDEILLTEPVMLRLAGEFHLVGDIHGNIDSLLRIFERCGYPPAARYLFLGDYVDRGLFGVEVLILLFALKCRFPAHIFLLRGNHETRTVAGDSGFLRECRQKYSESFFQKCHNTFQFLPFAAVVNENIFCVHGGLSQLLEDIETFERLCKPDEVLDPIFVDLVWSDPCARTRTFTPSDRGISYTFGEKPLNAFLEENELLLLVRSHELCPQGVDFPFPGSEKCMTVFSTTDYCGHENQGAVVSLSPDLDLDVIVFNVLNDEAKQKRRVLFPEWLLRETTASLDVSGLPIEAALPEFPLEIGC